MKNYSFYVGIDISKSKLDVVLIENVLTNKSEHFIVDNTDKGIKQMINLLKKKKIDLDKTLFCFENTGVYTCPLSTNLSDLKLDYWIVPAIEIKRSKGISRGKNDKTDAKDIAWYSVRNIDKLKLSSIAEKEIQQLKLLFAERKKVKKAIMLFGSTKENKKFISDDVFNIVSKTNENVIKQLKKCLKELEAKIKDIIKNNTELKVQFDLIKSVPGVGQQTALYLLIATKGFTAFENSRQFACYSGTAPFEYRSGSSIRGGTKVNHMADKKMKSLLQMAALAAIKHDPQIKEYYNKKLKEGKNKMLVQNNIRCKIIDRVFSVIKRNSPYINTYKFAS
jgi:transposase